MRYACIEEKKRKDNEIQNERDVVTAKKSKDNKKTEKNFNIN